MAFDTYDTNSNGDEVVKTSRITEKDVLVVRDYSKKRNNVNWGQFDTSVFDKDDIILLVDGDWLAFASTSNEMVRSVDFEHDGKVINFESCYTGIKKYCNENNLDYVPNCGVKKHYMKDNSIRNAKSTIKKKLFKAISKTKATKVVMFLGSTGNHRSSLPLPKLNNIGHFNYKGQREPEWTPTDLPEIKKWLHDTWMSHWAMDEEADDCITITKHELDTKGVKSYIHGVDKDYNGEQIGGLYILGHQTNPEWWEDTEENKLGWIRSTKTKGNSNKMIGHGDMFLAYQIITSDDADNYSAKAMLKGFGTLKSFGIKDCEKYLIQFKTRKELWQGVLDFFIKYLPSEFEYEDCFGVTHKATPLTMLDLYFKCAKMREHKDHIADVINDRLKPLGIPYD